MMNADGSNQKQLTYESAQTSFGVSASPDGRYIVFASRRAGASNIWRVNSDGTNLKQLTNGGGELNPFCSPDGRSVIYYTSSENDRTAWRVSIEGGDAVQLTGLSSNILGISSDGALTAYGASKGGVKKIGIISSPDNQPVKVIDLPPTSKPRRMEWAPDGRAITYIDTRSGISNIWNQPLDGGPAKQLTNFASDNIWAFGWSRDGKQLACVRGAMTNDVVLISEFK